MLGVHGGAAVGLLTVVEAAARVQRSRRQIERYIGAGLEVVARDARGRRFVRESDLLRVFRAHLLANPTRRRPDSHDDTAGW